MSNNVDYAKERLRRIKERQNQIGTQQDRMLGNYSPAFLQIYDFFKRTFEAGILTFSGAGLEFDVVYEEYAPHALFTFREYENGRVKKEALRQYEQAKEEHNYISGPDAPMLPMPRLVYRTSEPEEFIAVVKAKKSWGLWVKLWSEAIAEGTFTRFEIWRVFTAADIGIPPPPTGKNGMDPEFWKDFDMYMPEPFFQELENAIYKARVTWFDQNRTPKHGN